MSPTPVLKHPRPSNRAKKKNRLPSTKKMTPKPLLGSQENQGKQNRATHVTNSPGGGQSRKVAPTGFLSLLKQQTCAEYWAIVSTFLIVILIIIIIYVALTVLTNHQLQVVGTVGGFSMNLSSPSQRRTVTTKTHEVPPAAPACPVTSCPDGWIGYLGKCYYFSVDEANWTSSQSNCSAHGASLAGIDTQQEMDFMKRYKGLSHHWIGLRRDLGQPWKWTNGTEFNNWFLILGGEKCAFLYQKDIGSAGCSGESHWICSKSMEETGGKAQ